MKISSKTLAALHQYFISEGSTEPNDVADFLETDDEAIVNAYVDALKAKYPDIYGGEVAEESAPAPKTADKGHSSYFLIDNDTGLTKELELLKTKNGKLYLQTIEPKEVVSIVVGGEQIEVDLVKLRKKAPGEKLGNHLVSTLILAAELAKG
jgi:ectoine hydroxylase-related dioxygenase (phytanoyl-CoA dioxygenase family)